MARRVTTVALAWIILGVASARSETKILIDKTPHEGAQKPLVAAIEADKVASSPEPALRVEVRYVGRYFECRAPGPETKDVINGATVPTVKVVTHGLSTGAAGLTFKNSAPPMRITLKLTGAPNKDLSRLTLSSGALTLEVGVVGTSTTNRYFDSRGRQQCRAERAAYTVQAKRTAGGDIDVQLRRGAGASLGNSVQVYWEGMATNTEQLLRQLGQIRGGCKMAR